MGTIIALSNQKGGVGKTTLAVHLATYLARLNRRVALIDGDPQGNATSWLLDGDMTQNGFPRLLINEEPIANVLTPVPSWGVALLPGNAQTGKVLGYIGANPNEAFDTVADAIRPISDITDYAIIDMPPSRAAGFQELLFAADWIIVPTQLERLSLEGVTFMAQVSTELQQRYGRGPSVLGIVPNMVRPVKEHRAQLEQLEETFGEVVWPSIPQSVRASEACGYGQNLFEFAPNENVTQALISIVERVVQTLEGQHAQS